MCECVTALVVSVCFLILVLFFFSLLLFYMGKVKLAFWVRGENVTGGVGWIAWKHAFLGAG